MKYEHLKYLVCPTCKENLVFREVKKQSNSHIETGILQCSKCSHQYDIIQHIPRFVQTADYVRGFGLEWTKHAKTQYDSYTGSNISETRFHNETMWPKELSGEVILEVGSGSGRFTEQAASTGATVVSMDLSSSVDANYASNGYRDNVLIVQGDIYKMPFRKNFFDKLFCFGVLQHTPSPDLAFAELPCYLKSGGNLVIDIYRKKTGITGLIRRLFSTKYWIRPITRNISPEKLYPWCKLYLEFMWPAARMINKIPFFGTHLNWQLLIADYRGKFKLSEEMLKEWAILDTFDTLSAKYEYPQSIKTVERWFRNALMYNIDIKYDPNLIVGRGVKP
jgi:ubiquinone/menaquinone biosynthesis C-methylase UbiE/uncharacterized protein YbaR (Trm112 family)